MEHLEESPVTAQHIQTWTRRDPVLLRVLLFVERGWPHNCDTSLSAHSAKKNELSVYQGCVMWGARIVVPLHGRNAVLQQLHKGHPGMTRMKSLAHMYVWWPGLDKDIEKSVRQCCHCQEQQLLPPVAPLQL